MFYPYQLQRKIMSYTAADIKELPYPDCVRMRPGMYIGPTDVNGQKTAIREILNNSVDEHLAGHCSEINVIRWDDLTFSIEDNGRGVPHTDPSNPKKNVMKDIFGKLHSGRNFVSKTFYSTGLNGVGSSVVSALSETFQVRSRRDNEDHTIEFKKGIYKSINVISSPSNSKGYKTGTKVKFTLDGSLFEGKLDDGEIISLLKETAFLNAGLKITYLNQTSNKPYEVYEYNNGIAEYLESKVNNKKTVISTPIKISSTVNNCKIEISFTYVDAFIDESITSFVNTINTSDHGTHVTGFKRALSQAFNKAIKDGNIIKEQLDPEDLREGLVAIVSVFLYEPKFTSQTKQKLSNDDVNGFVFKACNEGINDWINKNPKLLKVLATKFALSAKGRLAKKRAVDQIRKDNGSTLSSLNSIKKFTDCNTDNVELAELFLVEGNSAQGTVINGRDNETQAVFILKGKPINSFEMDYSSVMKNSEAADLISVLKCGYKSTFNIDKLRFGKIIVLADADDDGLRV